MDISSFQELYQQVFVVILGKAKDKREGADVRADIVKLKIGDDAVALAQMAAIHQNAACDCLLSDAELAVKLKRARLYRHGTRGLTWSAIFFNDAKRNLRPGQPQCQNKAGGTGSNNQYLLCHVCGACDLSATDSCLFHSYQFHVKNQSRIRRDGRTCATRSIAKSRRNTQLPLAADLHPYNALIPAFNDLAGAKFKFNGLA